MEASLADADLEIITSIVSMQEERKTDMFATSLIGLYGASSPRHRRICRISIGVNSGLGHTTHYRSHDFSNASHVFKLPLEECPKLDSQLSEMNPNRIHEFHVDM